MKVTSGKVIVVDPGHVNEHKRLGKVIVVSNGDYSSEITKVRLKIGFSNEAEYLRDLSLVKAGINPSSLKWEKIGGYVVDSGMAGLFDASIFTTNSPEELDGWYYDEAIDVSKPTSFFNGGAMVTPTAFDDEGFDVYTAKKGTDVVGIKIEFISERDIAFINTPTLSAGKSTVIYHTSNLEIPLYEVPKANSTDVQFVEMQKDGMFGAIDFAKQYDGIDKMDVITKLAKFKVPKDGKIAKIFRLSKRMTDVQLEAGSFIITDKSILKQFNGDLNRLMHFTPKAHNVLNFIKFDAPAGVYSIALDSVKKPGEASAFARVAAIRIMGS